MICPICGRELSEKLISNHHLIPKTFKGTDMVPLHQICHRKLHSVFTEREMLNYYHTIDRLLENEEIQKFVKWVSKKPPEYYSGSIETSTRRKKRK